MNGILNRHRHRHERKMNSVVKNHCIEEDFRQYSNNKIYANWNTASRNEFYVR